VPTAPMVETMSAVQHRTIVGRDDELGVGLGLPNAALGTIELFEGSRRKLVPVPTADPKG
jgi:hypothetical protein